MKVALRDSRTGRRHFGLVATSNAATVLLFGDFQDPHLVGPVVDICRGLEIKNGDLLTPASAYSSRHRSSCAFNGLRAGVQRNRPGQRYR
jgi:hypothetical protein